MNFLKALTSCSTFKRVNEGKPPELIPEKPKSESFTTCTDMQNFVSMQVRFCVVYALGSLICIERSAVVEQLTCDRKTVSIDAKFLVYYGQVISLVDYRDPKNTFLKEQLQIVVLRVNQRKVALVVDELVGSLKAHFEEIIEPAKDLADRYNFLDGALRRKNYVYYIINVSKLLGSVFPRK